MTNLSIIGLGSIGLRHAKNALEMGCNVYGFDPDPQRGHLLDELGGIAVQSKEEVIGKAPSVIIASPSKYHKGDLQSAIAENRHVLVEKPLAHTDADLPGLIKQAEDRSLTIAVAHNLRFVPAIDKARSLILNGKLGEILWARLICSAYLPDWRPYQDHLQGYANDPQAGGVLFDVIHEVDLAHYLLNTNKVLAAKVRNTKTIGLSTEDCADLILSNDQGVQVSIHLDYITRPRRRVTEIAGTQGILTIYPSDNRYEFQGHDGETIEEFRGGKPSSCAYEYELKNFLLAVHSGEKVCCSIKEGLGVLRQVLQARKMAGLERYP